MKSFNQNRNETETRTERITENTQSFFYRWVKFCFLLRQMGKSYKGKERFLCLVSPYWHTMTGTNGSINITPIEKIVKSSGKVDGFTSTRPKMRVMSCKCPFRKEGDMKKRIFGNLWFCGCSATGGHGKPVAAWCNLSAWAERHQGCSKGSRRKDTYL